MPRCWHPRLQSPARVKVQEEKPALSDLWRVVRQDTNGVQTVELSGVGEHHAKTYAEGRENQIGSHHQTIWHERVPLKEPQI